LAAPSGDGEEPAKGLAVSNLKLMAVHAHPDDEVLSTGGILARYADEGLETILVTCTNGEQGDGPGGIKPGEAGHDPRAVGAVRVEELRRSCAELGVAHVELLGYRDSGMAGWPANSGPDAFANVPLKAAADRIAALIDVYQPTVVVTYDADGVSRHPDHVQTHRVTVEAARRTGVPAKLYFTAVPRSAVARLRATIGADGSGFIDGLGPDFGTPDERITTIVDVSGFVTRKRAALAAHASQTGELFLLRLPDPVLDLALGTESFVRGDADGPFGESDLFAGLR
jgi:LmbE family N-acetylglucosaminyl deacetylase